MKIEIETKFNIGDKVYYLRDAGITVDFISKIFYIKEQENEMIQYKVSWCPHNFPEYKLFKTKEELVKHLLENNFN